MGEPAAKTTDNFLCIHSSGWEGSQFHALTILAEFKMSKDENGDNVAEELSTRWYDTRGDNGVLEMDVEKPISEAQALDISWAWVHILEKEARRSAFQAEW